MRYRLLLRLLLRYHLLLQLLQLHLLLLPLLLHCRPLLHQLLRLWHVFR
jgi:hypothetical protein